MKHKALILVIATSPVWADDHASPASTPTAGYRSVFDDYKPMPDETVQDWRQANDEMGRLLGHMGHLEPSKAEPQSGAASAAAPREKK